MVSAVVADSVELGAAVVAGVVVLDAAVVVLGASVVVVSSAAMLSFAGAAANPAMVARTTIPPRMAPTAISQRGTLGPPDRADGDGGRAPGWAGGGIAGGGNEDPGDRGGDGAGMAPNGVEAAGGSADGRWGGG